MNDFVRSEFIQNLISTEVASQISQFQKLNSQIDQLLGQFSNFGDSIRHVHQHAPHVVSTRKSHNVASVLAAATTDLTNPVIDVKITQDLTIDWNALTADTVAEQYALDCENEQELVASGDVLFILLDAGYKHRRILFFGPQGMPKRTAGGATKSVDEGWMISEEDLELMEEEMDKFRDKTIMRKKFRV